MGFFKLQQASQVLSYSLLLYSFNVLAVRSFSPAFSFFPFFLLFINRVDRDYNEDFWQPYAADFSVLEENYPATAQNIIRLVHERNFNV